MSGTLASGNRYRIEGGELQILDSQGTVLARTAGSDITGTSVSGSDATIRRRNDGDLTLGFNSQADADALVRQIDEAFPAAAAPKLPGLGRIGGIAKAQERLRDTISEAMAPQQQGHPSTQEQVEALGFDPEKIDFDHLGQLQRIQGGIIPGEQLYAVYDMKGGGTGFIGLTDRRLIVQDEGIIRKKRSLVSIPYSQIAMVASLDEGGLMRKTSEMSIVTSGGQSFEFNFRSSDKAERAYGIIIRNLK